MSNFFAVDADVYVDANHATDAINDIAEYLRGAGWVVINADVHPKASEFGNLYGVERELQPADFLLSDVALSGQSEETARSAVQDAITQTGYYSIGARILASLQGKQDPNSPLTHAESLARLAIISAMFISAVVLAWRVLSIID